MIHEKVLQMADAAGELLLTANPGLGTLTLGLVLSDVVIVFEHEVLIASNNVLGR